MLSNLAAAAAATSASQDLATRNARERLLWASFALLGRPHSFLELGCGDAWMVRAARMVGCKPALGVDSDPQSRKDAARWARIYVCDPREPMQLRSTFDFVVAAHLECVDDLQTYVGNIARHSSKWAILTGAVSVYGYSWLHLMEANGFTYMGEASDRLTQFCLDFQEWPVWVYRK